jgi:flagellar biosynthesis anti-sigma factor FlgM
MKINNGNTKPVSSPQVQARDLNKEITQKNDGTKTSTADLTSASNVKMSDRAQMASKAKEIASKDTVDEAKIARLQKLIDAGNYRVDAEAIADRLVDAHLADGE